MAMPSVRIDLPHLVTMLVGYIFMRPLSRFLYRAEVRKAPGCQDGPAVYACNHRSFYDPCLVGMFLDRPLCYFARASLWKVPIIGQTLMVLHGLPIDRDTPQLEVMRRTVTELKAGRNVLIFPEGTRTRTGQLGRLREGPALFARRAGVPVVPVYVHASERAWPRGGLVPRLSSTRVAIRYGRPLIPPADLAPRLRDRWITVALERWMRRQEAVFRAGRGRRPRAGGAPG